MISRGMIEGPLEFGNGYVYKGNGEVYASLIVGVPVSLIFIYAGYRVYKTEGEFKEVNLLDKNLIFILSFFRESKN